MNQILYGKTSENITLQDSINSCSSYLIGSLALVYSAKFCKLLQLDEQGKLYDSNKQEIQINTSNNYIFEARIFNENHELRWLNENNGEGRAVIISEHPLNNCLDNDLAQLESVDTIEQKYLLWGEKVKNLDENWQRLSTARIGSLDVFIAQTLPKDKRVYLKTKEYLKVMDNCGNVSVVEERLIKLEVA